MFIRQCTRVVSGKRQAYWALVESHRTARGPRQRVVAWLGKLDEAGRLGVQQAAESPNADAADPRRPAGQEQVPWSLSALILVIARLLEPASELYTAEQWYPKTALPELLGVPVERVDNNRLYRALDELLPHQEWLQRHLKQRLGYLFALEYDILLYEVTSTFFEGKAAFPMADTEENQSEFPQSKNQKKGVGFPIVRFVVLLSLSVGTVLECALGACRGKKTGEQNLFRQMWDALKFGDILLGDRLYDTYWDIALLHRLGVDVVLGMKQSRRCDFRCGEKLGPDDHVVLWKKPKYAASRFKSKAEWESLPDTLKMREVRATIRRKGYRNRTVIIATTLLDAELYSGKELTDLFAQRWRCELDLRSIKRALGMHHLRCKTPDIVCKELWTYLLAYNLIRVRMAQAAAVHGVMPRKLSFTAAKNHIHNFAPYLKTASEADHQRFETGAPPRHRALPCRQPPREKGTTSRQKTRTEIFVPDAAQSPSEETTSGLNTCH